MALPTPPIVVPPPSQVLRTTWSFESGTDKCVAIASSGSTSLRVTVGRAAPIQLAVFLAASMAQKLPVPLRFSGPAGNWVVSARPVASRQLFASLGADNVALTRVLVLLSGGTFDVGTSDQPIVSLAIAPSEASGQHWFDCARRQML